MTCDFPSLFLAALVLLSVAGCSFRYSIGDEERQSRTTVGSLYASSGSEAPESTDAARCRESLRSAADEHDRFRDGTDALMIIDVILGVATGILAGFAAADTPGADASDVAMAVDSERGVSPLEAFSIGLGGATALSGGLTVAFAQLMGDRQGQVEERGALLDLLTDDDASNDPTSSAVEARCR